MLEPPMIAALRRFLQNITRTRTKSAIQARLERILGETINDISLYEQALRHRSTVQEPYDGRLQSNERLEYLGDATLELIISEHLYKAFPEEMEGFLTLLRSKLVRGRALADIARSIELGTIINMSDVVAQQGGRERQSILSDTFEALVGALYLDQGLDASRRFVYRTMLEGTDLSTLAKREDNFKSLLQEYVQEREWPYPTYQVVDTQGPPHARIFKVSVSVNSQVVATGRSNSKKRAEQKASKEALKRLKKAEKRNKKGPHQNHKGALHAFVQAKKWPHPVYRLINTDGPPHEPIFTVEVEVKGKVRVAQQAKTKKGAGHSAAREALKQLQRTADSTER